MRTKWQFPVYFSGLVLAITATAVSCSNDESTAPQSSVVAQKAPETQVNPSWPGQYHTDAVSFVFSKLSKAGNLATQAAGCRVAIAAIKEFDKSYRKPSGVSGVADAFVSEDVCTQVNSAGDIRAVDESATPRYAASGLSPQAVALLEQIRRSVSSNVGGSSMVSTVNAIQNMAVATLNPAEAAVVAGTASVAINSAQYWGDNSHNWRALSPESGGLRTQLYTSSTFGTGLRTSIDDGGCGIVAADAVAFLQSILYSWYFGPIGWEEAAVRSVIASTLAALRCLL